MEYIKKEDVEKMLDDAQLISDGEYCGYCTEDVSINSIEIQDVAPVVHGKWIADMTTTLETVKCSVCKKVFQAYYSDYQYCPICGAKMDL